MVSSQDVVLDLLRKYYINNCYPSTTRSNFQDWINGLSVEDAVYFATQQANSEQGTKIVFTVGDQTLGTAADAMESGYEPHATFLHSNEDAQMKDRREKIIREGGSVSGPAMLTPGGHMQYAVSHEKGKFEPKPNSYITLPRGKFDMSRSIVAFDHPYTSGYHTNPKTQNEVQELTSNLYAFGERKKFGRVHLMARVKDHGGKDTRGVYTLNPKECYPYAVQKTKVTRHETTVGKYKGTPLNPAKQSLIFKYANFRELFKPLNSLADILSSDPNNEMLQTAFMERLKVDLQNPRFPKVLRGNIINLMNSAENESIVLDILEAVTEFNPATEKTVEKVSMEDAMDAGEYEFSDDEPE